MKLPKVDVNQIPEIPYIPCGCGCIYFIEARKFKKIQKYGSKIVGDKETVAFQVFLCLECNSELQA